MDFTATSYGGPSTNGTAHPILAPGTWVKAADQNNFGTVNHDDGGPTVNVHFVSPEGNEANVDLPRTSLTVTGRADHKRPRVGTLRTRAPDATPKAPAIDAFTAWQAARLISGHDIEGEPSGPFREILDDLAALPLELRHDALEGMLEGHPDAAAIIEAIFETADPGGPAPQPPMNGRTAWIVRRLLEGETFDLEFIQDAQEPYRPLIEGLQSARREGRLGVLTKHLEGKPDADAIHQAVMRADPARPMPMIDGEPDGDDDWGPLRLRSLPPAAPFPVEVFPEALRRYCVEAASALLAPVDFVGASMLVVAGAAIGQSVNIRLKRTWTESPELFLIPVAKPGKTKTPAIKTVVKPLTEINHTLRKQSQEARDAWDEAKKAHARDPDKAEPPGPEPPQLRAVVKDITRESLVIVLRDNPRGVLVDPDEASAWVASFNEYKAGGADRQFWLSIWSNVRVSVDRKGGRESTDVPFPFASVIGGLPPAMLGKLADERGRDDGFIDRILFTYPDDNAFPPQRWNDTELSEDAETDWTKAVRRLQETPMVHDSGADLDHPYFVEFTVPARSEWATWYGEHSAETEEIGFPERQAGPWAKMRAYAARFALILSRLRWACDPTSDGNQPSPVNAEDVRGAIALADYFKSHFARIIHETTGGVGSPDARAILRWIERNALAVFKQSELTRDFPRFRTDPDALDAALAELAERNVICRLLDPDRPEGTRGRKPLPTYAVNPSLLAPENCVNCENADPDPHFRNKSDSPVLPGEGREA